MTREDRRYAINALRDMAIPEYSSLYKAISMAVDALAASPVWVPVSEKWPADIGKYYLVCYEDGDITIECLYQNGNDEPFFSGMCAGVVAWQELPAPYSAERS